MGLQLRLIPTFASGPVYIAALAAVREWGKWGFGEWAAKGWKTGDQGRRCLGFVEGEDGVCCEGWRDCVWGRCLDRSVATEVRCEVSLIFLSSDRRFVLCVERLWPSVCEFRMLLLPNP